MVNSHSNSFPSWKCRGMHVHCHGQQEQCDDEHLLSQTQNNRVVSKHVHQANSRAKMPLYIAQREMPSWLRLAPRPTGAAIQANLGGNCACGGTCGKCGDKLKAQVGAGGAPHTPPRRRRRRQPTPSATPTCTYHVIYANVRKLPCASPWCGRGIIYDVTSVTATGSGCPTSLVGLRVREVVTNNHGCVAGNVNAGSGCTITAAGNLIDDAGNPCQDQYSICDNATAFPATGCREIVTQQIYVGNVLADTRTITFTITRTAGGGCIGNVARS
jgi:hypothetical protein